MIKKFLEKGWQWPLFIFGLIGITGALDVTFLVLASGHPSLQAEEDSYERGVHWDTERAARDASANLGWTVETDFSRYGDDGKPVQLTVSAKDANSLPIRGATVSVLAFHRAYASERLTGHLAPSGDAYGVSLPAKRPGLWQVEVTVTKGDSRYFKSFPTELRWIR